MDCQQSTSMDEYNIYYGSIYYYNKGDLKLNVLVVTEV